MVSLKYDKVKVAKEIAKTADIILRTETGAEIPDDNDDVIGVIVIRFKKHNASTTVMGDMSARNVIDIFDQLLDRVIIPKSKGDSIAVS